jgi:hypothetical protein
LPFIADKQVLIGLKRLDALGEALDEIFGPSGSGVVRDCVGRPGCGPNASKAAASRTQGYSTRNFFVARREAEPKGNPAVLWHRD